MDNTNLTTQTSNVEIIKKRIYVIRGQRVMLDRDAQRCLGPTAGATGSSSETDWVQTGGHGYRRINF